MKTNSTYEVKVKYKDKILTKNFYIIMSFDGAGSEVALGYFMHKMNNKEKTRTKRTFKMNFSTEDFYIDSSSIITLPKKAFIKKVGFGSEELTSELIHDSELEDMKDI